METSSFFQYYIHYTPRIRYLKIFLQSKNMYLNLAATYLSRQKASQHKDLTISDFLITITYVETA